MTDSIDLYGANEDWRDDLPEYRAWLEQEKELEIDANY